MKKRFVLIAAIGLIACMVAVLAGCGGGDTGKAKEYMQKGDEYMEAAAALGEQLDEEMTDLFDAMAAGEIATTADFTSAAKEIESTGDDMIAEGKKAKEEYQKITDLSGVDDYVDYAEILISAADKGIEGLNKIVAMLDDMGEFFAAIEAGQVVDETQFATDLQTAAEEISDLGTEFEDKIQEAEDLKEEKNL